MSLVLTKEFWLATLERMLKTFCQALLAVGLTGATGLLNVDWAAALSAAGLAAVISVLTSIISAPVGGNGPSLANEVVEPQPVTPVEIVNPTPGDGEAP